jgi:hypothetical protein
VKGILALFHTSLLGKVGTSNRLCMLVEPPSQGGLSAQGVEIPTMFGTTAAEVRTLRAALGVCCRSRITGTLT